MNGRKSSITDPYTRSQIRIADDLLADDRLLLAEIGGRQLQRKAPAVIRKGAAAAAALVVPQHRLVARGPPFNRRDRALLPARHHVQRRLRAELIVEIDEGEHALDRVPDGRIEE